MKEIEIKINDDTADIIKRISQERDTTETKIIKELINKGLIFEKKEIKNKGFGNKLGEAQEKIEEIKKELKNKEEKITQLEDKVEKLNKEVESLNKENKYLKRNYELSEKSIIHKIKKIIFE